MNEVLFLLRLNGFFKPIADMHESIHTCILNTIYIAAPFKQYLFESRSHALTALNVLRGWTISSLGL